MENVEKQLPQSLIDVINNKATELEKFKFNERQIGHDGARKNLIKWCSNFSYFLDDFGPLEVIIRNISFISDEKVHKICMDFLVNNLKLAPENVHFAWLGSEIESSVRIMRLIKKAKGLRDILTLVKNKGVPGQKIIFIDDFLNSGGQLSSIIHTWFNGGNEPSIPDQLESEKRCILDDNEQRILRQCQLYFLFSYGMEQGRVKVDKAIKEFSLNAEIRTLHQYDDASGIFGNIDDIEHITNNISQKMSSDSIFSTYRSDNIKKIYAVCSLAGEQLLHFNKPEWSDEKLHNRILGYGNSAKLYVTENNIPTSTLTCLWCGGPINMQGKKITWEPLFQRKEKITPRPESHHFKSKSPCPPGATFNLDDYLLDNGSDRATPFEIMLVQQLDGSSIVAHEDKWQCATDEYFNIFESEAKNLLKTESCFVKVLHPKHYERFNNHTKYLLDKENKIPVKIKSINMISFGKNDFFMGIRIQFQAQELSLKHTLRMIHNLPMIKQSSSKKNIFKIKDKQFKIRNMFDSIIEDTVENAKLSHSHIKSIVFIREANNLFGSPFFDRIFSCFSNFSHPDDAYLKAPLNQNFAIGLDYDARISISEKGMVTLCGSQPAINYSSLQEMVMKQYYLQFSIGWYLSIIQRKAHLLPDDKPRIECEQILNRFDSFGKIPWCHQKFAVKFTNLVRQLFLE